jgi:hypothetical protein
MISALRLGPRQLVHQLGPQVFDQLGHRITHGFDAARQIPLGPSIGSVMQHEMDDVLASQEKNERPTEDHLGRRGKAI